MAGAGFFGLLGSPACGMPEWFIELSQCPRSISDRHSILHKGDVIDTPRDLNGAICLRM
jgi:hypothetical protein